ncbi:hypothetical protein ABGN28_12440 [Levilactobacillus brevis]|uniref:hypothetical protein n=1 Tax=Levilactobacillus brevis TaxID=1580 RepID=UPI00325BD71A
MITVSTLSFALADFSMVYWFIYFQYYWFSELVVLKHISLFCFLVAIGYTVVDLVNPFTFNSTPIGSALPVIVLLGFEFFLLGMRHQTEYLPAFIDVSILAYLLVEFIDLTVLALMIWLAGTGFATSLWGTLVELVVNNIVLALVASGLWLTRAPMENLIQSMLGRSTEYLFLAFMSALATVYILFEYSLQSGRLQEIT